MEKKVAVIGAGAAGLVSARELLREGHRVVVFEKGKRIGGTWVYEEPKNGDQGCHSSIYKSLRTNLPRECMGFLDHPFVTTTNGDARRYPGHEEVLAYLHDFADRFKLLQHVRLLTTVSYVGLMENGSEWLVKSIRSNSAEELEESFEAVVVSNGHYSKPRVAHIPGIERWPGEQHHSHLYRTPEPYKDKVVAVIGNGPSGQDITSDIAGCCKHVYWCANSWKYEPELNISNISRHLMISSADEDGTLHFKDGTSAVVEVILHCTGYLYDFSFLDTGEYLRVEDNRVEPLYKHIFPPALAPSLSFVGLPWKILPFPIFELQAKWIASALSGRTALPSVKKMENDTAEFYSSLEAQGVPKRYTHSLDLQMFDYAKWLAEASCSCVQLEDWRQEVYTNSRDNRRENPEGYRDEWNDEDLHTKVMDLLAD